MKRLVNENEMKSLIENLSKFKAIQKCSLFIFQKRFFMSLRASLNAVKRDVAAYVSELEQRISQLQQSASQFDFSISPTPGSSSLSPAKKQLDEIKALINSLKLEQIDRDANLLENQINQFITTQLPTIVQPFSKTLTSWKNQFNSVMTSAGKKYQELYDSLNKMDTGDLEKAAKTYTDYAKSLENLTKEINSVSLACDAILSNVQDNLEQHKKDFDVSLSGLSQQLQVDIMRAKTASNSAISQSNSQSQSTNFNNFFNSLQSEINMQCSQMEQRIQEAHSILDASEKQWDNDIEQFQKEIENELSSIHHNAGNQSSIEKQLLEVQRKVTEIEQQIDKL